MPTTVKSFLDELFIDGDVGQIILAKKKANAGFVRAGAFDTIDEAAAAVQDVDVYLKINRMHLDRILARSKHGIGGKNEVAVVRVIGLDIDTAKKNPKYPPRDTVLARMRVLMKNQPSLIVSSDGTTDGGLHLYYILSEPIVIDNSVWEQSVNYVNAIAKQIREEFEEILPEYQIDHIENIERIFRVAGGLRADGRLVDIVSSSGERYILEDLQRYPVEQGTDSIAVAGARVGDSPILDYLEAVGVETVEDYLRDRMQWSQIDSTHWIRPDSESNMPSGEVFQGLNGEWGITIRSNAVPGLEALQWYSLAHLFTAVEFGGDWRRSGAFCRAAIANLNGGAGAAGVFSRYYTDFDKYQMNDRAAAIWCYEKIKNLLYVPDKAEWRSWNGSAWVPAGELVFELVSQAMLEVSIDHSHLKKVQDAAIKAKMADAWTKHYRGYLNTRSFNGLKRALESTLYKMSDEFDEGPDFIHTPSFRIDLRTGEMLPASLEFFNTQTTVCDPADAVCRRWNLFLYEVCGGDVVLMGFLKRVVGYCITGGTAEQVMFLLHGRGQNGKSVFTQIIEYILNSYATQLDQSALTGVLDQHPTSIASLHRARLALASETDIGCTLREHVVKRITGTDKLVARHMREDFWSFTPTHKLILSTNNMPIIRGSDEGIWRRICVIKFDTYFDKPDRNLINKLKMEAPGILNWMLEGAREYLTQGLGTPEETQQLGVDLRNKMDIVGAWLDENCELAKDWTETNNFEYERDGVVIPHDEFCTPSAELYDDFKQYCFRFTLPCMTVTSFAARLHEKGLKNANKTSKRTRHWIGVRLKTSY